MCGRARCVGDASAADLLSEGGWVIFGSKKKDDWLYLASLLAHFPIDKLKYFFNSCD